MKLDQANSRQSLPKLGWIRYRNSREVVGEVKNVTVNPSCGKWYVSIQTEYEVPDPAHNAASIVGLDAGVTKLATLSDGTVYQPVNSFKANQRKLAALQRRLSRKVKFSLSETEAENPVPVLAYCQYPARLPSQSHQ
ncbi:transposase [Salmonella enterica]|uniref:Transposase n=1 Tax=Salmonella enterica I TaxID=59201 RepID=A0A3R1ATE7_SALET|nr:transposase [Salmonella enterica subsp. enterica serovar Dahomey]EEB7407197.1 transposase [Salmonella enterica]MML55549.1 transposase [Salmonella enterica subsp. enterica serovar Kidderminster]